MYTLKLSDGSSTVNFLDESLGYLLEDGGFRLRPPTKSSQWSGENPFSHGEALVSHSFGNREMEFVFEITGSTRDELLNNVSTIETLLRNARNRSITGAGDRVELQYQLDGASTVTYFEVLDGELQWPEDVLSVGQALQSKSNGDLVIYRFELSLTAKPFATDISPVSGSLVESPLTNGNGSGVTGGLTIVNHDDADAGDDNWVEIAAVDVDSEHSLISKVTMELLNGRASPLNRVYIGARKGDLGFKHIFEDDENIIGTPTADASYSGGTYTPLTVGSDPGTGTTAVGQWDVTTQAVLDATTGPFRVLARAGNGWNSNGRFRVEITIAGVHPLFTGEWVRGKGEQIIDLGTIYLPPEYPKVTDNIYPYEIKISGQKTDSGHANFTVNLDYLMLMPQDGGYRMIEFPVFGLSTIGNQLVDDGWEDVVYAAFPEKSGLPVGLLGALNLWPNTAQRIYFLQQSINGDALIDDSLSVTVHKAARFIGVS